MRVYPSHDETADTVNRRDHSGAVTVGDSIGYVNILWVVLGVTCLLVLVFTVFAFTLGACSKRREKELRKEKGSRKVPSSIISGDHEDNKSLLEAKAALQPASSRSSKDSHAAQFV